MSCWLRYVVITVTDLNLVQNHIKNIAPSSDPPHVGRGTPHTIPSLTHLASGPRSMPLAIDLPPSPRPPCPHAFTKSYIHVRPWTYQFNFDILIRLFYVLIIVEMSSCWIFVSPCGWRKHFTYFLRRKFAQFCNLQNGTSFYDTEAMKWHNYKLSSLWRLHSSQQRYM